MRNLSVVMLVLVAACGEPDASLPGAAEHGEPGPIPVAVNVDVLEETNIPGVRRSLDVRLSRRVSEEELRGIAEQLKGQDPTPYDRTFIVYYLPGMEPGAGGWATSHFNPDLEIRIIGTTLQQDQSLASTAESASAEEVIGTWVGEQPYMAARITLYREGGKTFILRKYADGSGSPAEVVETQTSRGHRYHEPGSRGDYVLITSAGMLELRDAEGLIASFRPAQ